MASLLGPGDTPLRRTRAVMAFGIAVLAVLVLLAVVLGYPAVAVWAVVLGVVLVVGHLWSWPRRNGRTDPEAELTRGTRSSVYGGLVVAASGGLATVMTGGSLERSLVRAGVATVVAVPLFLLVERRRRTA